MVLSLILVFSVRAADHCVMNLSVWATLEIWACLGVCEKCLKIDTFDLEIAQIFLAGRENVTLQPCLDPTTPAEAPRRSPSEA